jgi:hypothetical protein
MISLGARVCCRTDANERASISSRSQVGMTTEKVMRFIVGGVK